MRTLPPEEREEAMLFLRFLLLVVAIGFLIGVLGMAAYDIFLALELDRLLRRSKEPEPATQTGEAGGDASGGSGAAHRATASANRAWRRAAEDGGKTPADCRGVRPGAAKHRGGAGGRSGRSRQPGRRRGARDAVRGNAFCLAADRERRDV